MVRATRVDRDVTQAPSHTHEMRERKSNRRRPAAGSRAGTVTNLWSLGSGNRDGVNGFIIGTGFVGWNGTTVSVTGLNFTQGGLPPGTFLNSDGICFFGAGGVVLPLSTEVLSDSTLRILFTPADIVGAGALCITPMMPGMSLNNGIRCGGGVINFAA